jgi:hypothetical protein
MVYSDTVTFNGVVLFVTNVTPTKTQKTVKQQIGKSIAEIRILGLSTQQWELNVSGIVTGTTTALLTTNRTNLEALDAATPYAWTDGYHNGTYILQPGTLKFDDSGEKPMHYTYQFTIIQQ